MDYNLVTNIENCYISLPHLLFYSHIPALVVSLLLGIFVFLNNRSLISGLLLLIAGSFSLWSLFDLILWMGTDSRVIMFFWTLTDMSEILFFVLSLYFIYVFVDKKDVSFLKKIILFAIFSPVVFLMSSRYFLSNFDGGSCNALEFGPFLNYIYIAEISMAIWMVVVAIYKYFKTNDKNFRKQIAFVTTGVILFLMTFLGLGFLGEKLDSFKIEQYGLFGMLAFVAFLVYLIVKYQAFNIKLIGTQALVAVLVITIGSEYFFVESPINVILVGVTLIISLGAGYLLIKSVKSEVKRKEELQMMSDKLASTNDQLRKLDNAKSEFISIASHQLRTPLTAIKGFLSLLLEGSYGKLDPRHEDVLNKVYVSSERLIGLVEDLLNISRIESGRMEYKFDKWDIPKICTEVVDTFVLRAKDRGLYLDYKKPEQNFPEIMTDGSKLREVISNLIDNALKYTQRGGVNLRLYHEGNSIKIVVTDTGIGIPTTELPYLFSKFSRGKDTNRLNTGGTGLGLYVGKNMIEALNGKVWAESEGAGKGSRFIIELPINREKE